jgi:hypothetical protein
LLSDFHWELLVNHIAQRISDMTYVIVIICLPRALYVCARVDVSDQVLAARMYKQTPSL